MTDKREIWELLQPGLITEKQVVNGVMQEYVLVGDKRVMVCPTEVQDGRKYLVRDAERKPLYVAEPSIMD